MDYDRREPRSGLAVISEVDTVLSGWPIIAIVSCISFVIHIVVIIIGAVYYGQCTIEPLIPIFLICMGSLMIIGLVVSIATVRFFRHIFLI